MLRVSCMPILTNIIIMCAGKYSLYKGDYFGVVLQVSNDPLNVTHIKQCLTNDQSRIVYCVLHRCTADA